MIRHNVETLKSQVAAALKMYRDGRLLELSTSPLSHTPLVEDTFITGIPISADVRGRALQSVLRQATDRLRPGGEHSWTSLKWRNYNILHHFYIEGMRVAELAERMAIAEQTLYQARGDALSALSQIIFAELNEPRDSPARKQFAILDRYAMFSAEQQTILRLLAAFQRAMPTVLLHSLAADAGLRDVPNLLSSLITSGWVVVDDAATQLLLHPEVSSVLQAQLLPQKRHSWHRTIGRFYLDRREHFEAARHFRMGDSAETAANILINNYQTIVNDLQLEEMVALIGEFHRREVSENTWARLKITAGDAASLMEDIDTALAEYQEALSAPDVLVKALAYYSRANILQHKNLDEALAHYAYCISLLKFRKPVDKILVQAHIDRAFAYIEERRDVVLAERDLEEAERLISPDNRGIVSDLHTAWLRLCILRQTWAEAVEHGQMAWLAANEIRDATRMVRTAHNLGMTYARRGRFEEALPYLERSRDLAKGIGDQQRFALNGKTIGNALYMIKRFDEAVPHYQRAYTAFVELGNENWRAHTCYDLAEVYAELGDIPNMQHFYDEGLSVARVLGDERLIREFEEFGERHQGLFSKLNERQLAALEHVKIHGKITNKQYQELNQVSARQALRDLGELESAELLVKSGKGRSTHYRLPVE